MHALSHCATTICEARADAAFALLADASRVGSWALGAWDAELLADGTARGSSLFDGSEAYVRTYPDAERLCVDFAVGGDRDAMARRISAHVVPGTTLGLDRHQCVVTLIAWRHAGMSDDRWRQLTTSHEVEILLLRRQIEAEQSVNHTQK
jgi:hypothetical protein